MERVWNGYGTDTQLDITFQVLHSMVWNGGVWNGIRGPRSGALDRGLDQDVRSPLFRTFHIER